MMRRGSAVVLDDSRASGARLSNATKKSARWQKIGAERFVLQETKMGPSSLSTLLPSRVARMRATL